jgi:hypothetical protein
VLSAAIKVNVRQVYESSSGICGSAKFTKELQNFRELETGIPTTIKPLRNPLEAYK